MRGHPELYPKVPRTQAPSCAELAVGGAILDVNASERVLESCLSLRLLAGNLG